MFSLLHSYCSVERTEKGGAKVKSRIKDISESKNMPQNELAKLSGVSRTTISHLENGKENETMVGTLNAIARALEVPVSDLFAQNVQ